MRGKIVLAGLILGLCGIAASAQSRHRRHTRTMCTAPGVVTTEAVPRDTYVITGEESEHKVVFSDHDYVYINKGSSKGVKVGDEFSVIRPVEDPIKVEWTKWQSAILRKMGTVWEDEGARESRRCPAGCFHRASGTGMRIHAARRYRAALRRAPRAAHQDGDAISTVLLPPNGKALAMVITAQKFQPAVGKNDIVYVNLGNGQGVKVGDYFRIFRYTGTQNETAYQTPRYAFDVDGDLGPT